jgi:CBS domain-containing protein
MDRTDAILSVLKQKGTGVFSISPSTCVYDALEIMADKEIGALPVMVSGRLAGMVSERDYARKVILQGKSSKDTAVSEIMTSEVITVTPEDSVDTCMMLMTQHRVRHLPVVERDEVVGIVSLGDLVKYVISAQEQEISHLHAYITGGYPA